MSLLASPPSAGLFTGVDVVTPVPLTGVSVEVEIVGLGARVSVAHRYVNREATAIEAVYVFPLEEGAAVCGFEAVVDDRVVTGEVMERDRAFERYDEAIDRGDGAFLLDEHRPDAFQASVGNLPPGKSVLVRLTYVTELLVDGGQVRFTLPTVVAPRYAPEEDRRGVGQPDADALNPPVAWSVPYGLELTVRLQIPGGIASVASPSHAVAVALHDGQAVVTLAGTEVALDRDFVLTVESPALRVPCAWAERDGETTSVAVGFIPILETAATRAEVIFLVDRSGSMAGESIAEVRNALQLCLRSLAPGCAFNIVGFGDVYETLFAESRSYDQASLEEATRHVERLDADLGGTELRAALEFVLQQPARPGLRRCVMVLTDGSVTNTDRVIALAAAHRGNARVFTLGIGWAASQHLVRGLARAGGGTAEFIQPGERVEARVLRQFGRLLAPAMADVHLEWLDGDVHSVPVEVPPVFSGQRLLVYGIVTGRMPHGARLTATLPDGVRSWEVAIPDAPADGRVVTTLAVRARIRELEEAPEWVSARGSRQHDRKLSSVRRQVIELATRHRLLSRDTSFVAVERRDTPVHGDMQLRRVPIRIAHGWGGLSQGRLQSSRQLHEVCVDSALAMTTATAHMDDVAGWFGALASPDAASSDQQPMRLRRREGTVPHGRLARAARPRALDTLVAQQEAEGSWPLTNELARALGQTLGVLEGTQPQAPGDMRRAWATALALAWLDLFAATAEEEWRLLADKAVRWLEQQPAPAAGGWMSLARQHLTR